MSGEVVRTGSGALPQRIALPSSSSREARSRARLVQASHPRSLALSAHPIRRKVHIAASPLPVGTAVSFSIMRRCSSVSGASDAWALGSGVPACGRQRQQIRSAFIEGCVQRRAATPGDSERVRHARREAVSCRGDAHQAPRANDQRGRLDSGLTMRCAYRQAPPRGMMPSATSSRRLQTAPRSGPSPRRNRARCRTCL